MTMTVEVFSSRKKKKNLFSIFFLCAYYRGSHWTCSAKKAVLKNFTFFAGKRVYWRQQHACFPANIAKGHLFCRKSANSCFCYQSTHSNLQNVLTFQFSHLYMQTRQQKLNILTFPIIVISI